MSQQNPYAPPRAEVAEIAPPTDAAPPLWNPAAAASWSLLFSPIFGAFLHMRNWQALGEPDKAAKSKTWIVATIVFLVVASLAPILIPSAALDALGRFGGIAILIAWYYALGKSQQALVAARFGKSYPRRGWLKPILAALGVVLAFFLVVFVIAFIIGAASGPA
jgi:hypothetical protein